MNVIEMCLWMSALAISCVGTWVSCFPGRVPSVLHLLYHYGKAGDKRILEKQPSLKLLLVPKRSPTFHTYTNDTFKYFTNLFGRWFVHFYIFAVGVLATALWAEWIVYFRQDESFVHKIIPFLSQPSPIHSAGSVIVATSLCLFHAVQRLYECLFVSVFSESYMSIAHYAYGIYFYLAVGLALLVEAPGFVPHKIGGWTFDWITLPHFGGVLLFSYGSRMQLRSNAVLASLRRKGEVRSHDYDVPSDSTFELVSCPHYLGEILVYVGVCAVFAARNASMLAVLANVMANQLFAASMMHEWYKNNFPDYPPHRRALLPYIF